ncbi:MAG: hypothetical protein N3G18_02495 [Candidatus Saccharicenans sp.]|nr:hypothetical protein [Candidatus Saccharicenans sp.]
MSPPYSGDFFSILHTMSTYYRLTMLKANGSEGRLILSHHLRPYVDILKQAIPSL